MRSEAVASLRTILGKKAFGNIEAAQRLLHQGGRLWDQGKLLRAAEAAELRITGWPIGLVIHEEGLRPVPTSEGIEARLRGYDGIAWRDYWAFHKDGSYYVARLFEEDFGTTDFISSQGHPAKSLWFDLRICRIAEVIFHSASIYRELGVPPDEPYLLAVNHGGLIGREFYVSTDRRFVRRGRICRTPAAGWTKELTQDYVASELKTLVGDVADGLFVLFDSAQVEQLIIDEIVDRFLGWRVVG